MIEDRIMKLRDFTQARSFKVYRSFLSGDYRLQFKRMKYNYAQRNAEILRIMCDSEDAIVFPKEQITFTRTKTNIPRYFDDKFIKKNYRTKRGTLYDVVHNICPDYSILLNYGLENRLNLARSLLDAIERKEREMFLARVVRFIFDRIAGFILNRCIGRRGVNFSHRISIKLQNILTRILASRKEKAEKIFLQTVIQSIEAVLGIAERYSIAAKAAGNTKIETIMKRMPRLAPVSFHEALQSIRIISSAFYLSNVFQLGFGRMDQYLYPFYEQDTTGGKITREDAKNLLAEFFISLNRDTDLYFGVQQGDNGQSLMLGGCKADGSSAVNDLTYLIMETARDLRLIDPKINLRIDSNTRQDLLELGCELTKCGLGFPQYSNDEVVIPVLVKHGYSLEDARNYTVAACWEFIIPGKGMDVVNQGAVSFPAAVDHAFSRALRSGFTMEKLRKNIQKSVKVQVRDILKKRDIRLLPSPLVSVFMHGALEAKKDASSNARYHNIGIHGAGSANGADSLAAIKVIYERDGIDGLKKLEEAKQNNFAGYEALRTQLMDDMPKVGNASETADNELKFLFDRFADCAEELSTTKRTIRPGTGSAQFYILLTDPKNKRLLEPTVRATVDGRLDGEPFSSGLAPSHGIKVNGVVSVLKSFAAIDYSRIMNGGPITIELTPSVFNSNEGIKKLVQLLRYFVRVGDQQLQLNVLDAETLKAAVKNPDKYRNLIVRVWGWSGYFCELAPEYQQHIIHRHQYVL
jgi:formate C-acetyltransferase